MPDKLEWNSTNLTKVIASLIERAAKPDEAEFRTRLLSLQGGKQEVANLIQTPADWDQRHIVFDYFVDQGREPASESADNKFNENESLTLVDMGSEGMLGQRVVFRCRNMTKRLRAEWVDQ